MAIYKMVGDKENLVSIAKTSFGQQGVLERQDLQRILRDQPEVLGEGLLIISEEFCDWQDSSRRIDLLALDTTGRLVVIELKRGDTGSHMDLQAIRYAAMVANMTRQRAVNTYQEYLEKRARSENKSVDADAAETGIREHLEDNDTEGIASANPRIILVSEGFSSELTTCALWLNNREMDVTCVRIQPYRSGTELLIETSQIIPLPEAHDYLVKVREQQSEDRELLSVKRPRIPGGLAFRDRIKESEEQFRPDLERVYLWASKLEEDGLASLETRLGKTTRLLVWVPDGYTLVTVYNESNAARIKFITKNLKYHSSSSLDRLGDNLGVDFSQVRGDVKRSLSAMNPDSLSALTDAYREANGLLVDDAAAE